VPQHDGRTGRIAAQAIADTFAPITVSRWLNPLIGGTTMA
jgi:hypothetical protein